MANTRYNQRYRDAETRMEAAMLHLMERMDFDDITITTLCQEAGVNRSTFYAHFSDMAEMLDAMETTLSQELLDRYTGFTPPGRGSRQILSPASLGPFLEHIRRHRFFYSVILRTRKTFPIEQGQERLLEEVIRPACLRVGIDRQEDIDYYLIYFEAGFSMILKHWVETDCAKEVDQLAKTIHACIPAVLQGTDDTGDLNRTGSTSGKKKAPQVTRGLDGG